MATFDIHIPLPVLIANQAFRVEFSTDGVTYFLLGLRDNTPFTFIGADDTLYYFRFTLLSSLTPLIECEPKVRTYYAAGPSECVTGDSEIARFGQNYFLQTEISFPSPYNEPCGGYQVVYGTQNPYTTLNIASFYTSPSNNPLMLPAINSDYDIWLYSLDCFGNRTLCFHNEVPALDEPCDHALLTKVELVRENGIWKIKFTLTPSSPASATYKIAYSQINNVTTGIPDPGGIVTFTATGNNPEQFEIQVQPNQNILPTNGFDKILYQGSITDYCNYTTNFIAQQCCPDGYSLEDDMCVLVTRVAAILDSELPSFTAVKKQDANYTRCNTSLYTGFNIDGTGTYTVITTPYWSNTGGGTGPTNGPMNRTAIWNGAGDDPFGVPVTLGIQITVPTAKTLYLGLGVDNRATVRINCEDVLIQNVAAMYAQHVADGCSPFATVDVTYKMWHIIPIDFVEGINFIEIAVINDAGPGAFGFQIYDNTFAEIAAATSDAGLTIIDSSERYVGQTIDAFRYRCPNDDECSTVVFEDDGYWCYERRTVESQC